MMKYKCLVLVIFVILLTVLGCATQKLDNSSADNNIIPSPIEPAPAVTVDPIKEKISKMTVQEKLGQMVIMGLDGYRIDETAETLIQEYKVGGIILFSRNIENSKQLLTLINSLKLENAKNDIPLFISVDEEGGKVSRMPSELLKLPANEVIGRKNDELLSFDIGGMLAEELSSFGFNMDFAPVLDINSNPNNTIIGDRAFGDNPELVSRLGIQVMKGIQAGGVIPIVKHFPGHGDTSVDSHIGLPVVEYDMDRLSSFELLPFGSVIENQADGIMVAHILMKKIDENTPASLSKRVVTDLLRKQLKFDGLVITDDITMKAITDNYKIGDAAVKALNAGCDIILVCHGENNRTAVMKALLQAVNNGTISEERLDESVYRVLKLKQKYSLKDAVIDTINVEEINSKITTLLNKK